MYEPSYSKIEYRAEHHAQTRPHAEFRDVFNGLCPMVESDFEEMAALVNTNGIGLSA